MINFIKKVKSLFVKKFIEQLRVMKSLYLIYKKPIRVSDKGCKRALVCYITKPFENGVFSSHSNQMEVILMAETLSELNFSVDAVDYNSKFNINYSDYDLLIGFGEIFAASYTKTFRGKRILHLTGANPNFSNEAEARRCHDVRSRKGSFLLPRREVYWPWMYSAINSDAIFVLGNEWTKSTYYKINENIFLLPVPYVSICGPQHYSAKNNYNFCWFAGAGAVHKGLDLVLDAISTLDIDVHLDICGAIDQESDFLKLYSNLLFMNQKVTYHGFVDVNSEKMQEIIQKNNFVIFPSCSEGGGSSVITCMDAGLIPITTKESSVNIFDFGITIESLTVKAVKKAMLFAIELKVEELRTRSIKSANYAKSHHSYKIYKRSLKRSLIKVISK